MSARDPAVRERIKEIKAFTESVKNHRDDKDYNAILDRSDKIRGSQAILDILTSNRLPFTLSGEDYFDESMHSVKSGSILPPLSTSKASSSTNNIIPPPSNAITSLRKKSIYSANTSNSPSFTLGSSSRDGRSSSAAAFFPPIKPYLKFKAQTEISLEASKLASHDSKLQYVLSLFNLIIKQRHIDPNRLYYEAGTIFVEMNIFDRAAICFEKSINQLSDIQVIVDTVYLPKDVSYLRKIERMSPTLLPKFLAQRSQQRETYTHLEKEKQRLRVRSAHCELSRLYSLTSLHDLWKAHEHLQLAFQICLTSEEHQHCLFYFHELIITLSEDVLQGKAQFQEYEQILRGSAGPMTDAHVHILLELVELQPWNSHFHAWLGVRYTEKSEFEEAKFHYKRSRDLEKALPDRQATLELWQRKPSQGGEDTEESLQMKREIDKNINKHTLYQYSNYNASQEEMRIKELKKDLSWFPGKHTDQMTILYTPPPQGWTGQS